MYLQIVWPHKAKISKYKTNNLFKKEQTPLTLLLKIIAATLKIIITIINFSIVITAIKVH